jgi:hypothetical protein
MQSRAAIVEDINHVRTAQQRELERLGGRAPSLEEQRAMQLMAREHRQLFEDLEMSVPQPGPTDRPGDYQVALLQRLQRFSPTFRDSNLGRLAASGGLARGIEAAIVADATAVAGDRTIGSFRRKGHLRELRRTDQSGQVTSVLFAGDPRSWMSSFMSPVVTCVEAFNTGRRR